MIQCNQIKYKTQKTAPFILGYLDHYKQAATKTMKQNIYFNCLLFVFKYPLNLKIRLINYCLFYTCLK